MKLDRLIQKCSDETYRKVRLRGCVQKFPDWVDNEIYAYNNKHSLRSNTKGYGGKTHWTDSQNSDITAPSGRKLYHLQFSLQADSPETFGYTLVVIRYYIEGRSWEFFSSRPERLWVPPSLLSNGY
jgi:hypothetical protein